VSTILLSSLHDPEARLLRLVQPLSTDDQPTGRAWREIAENYAFRLVVASPPTSANTCRALEVAGFEVVVGTDAPDRGLWAMVDRALSKPVERIHFCDLDRFVHWLYRFPDELLRLPSAWGQHDLTMLVRTGRAFATHPPCQTLTEAIGNRVIAERIGIPHADAFSGSYVWSRRAARALVDATCPRDVRFYAEGVLAPFRAGCSIGYLEVEGLEWETPDQYPDEIARFGYDAWLDRFQSPAQWRQRVEMARLWVDAAIG
jgi:hypothetical protein